MKHLKTNSKTSADYFATIYTDGGSRNTGVHKGGHVNETDKAAWAYLIEWDNGRTYGSGENLVLQIIRWSCSD